LEARLSAVEKSSGYQHQTRAQFTAQSEKAGESVKLDYLQGAVLLLENHTGAIRALVGGRDYAQSSYNRALSAKRQVGSTFKPLVYAAAIEKAGMLPEFLISDDPIKPGEIQSAEGSFSPQNSDGTFLGLQPMEFGLAKSRNTMTVRIGERAGMDNVIGVADVAGIKEIAGRSPQIYIGNLGATLKSMTSAYSVFPNAGKRCRPFVIDRIENANGEILFRSGQIEYEVVSPGTAYLMRGMMQKVMQPGGTGAGIKQFGLKAPVGGKTGTTDDYKDAWFIGFNPSHTCGIWVGLDDPERIVGQGYGGRLAMPIWADVMKQIEKLQPDVAKLNFPRVGLVEAEICPVSGQLASSNCPQTLKLNVPEDRVPSTYCQQHAGSPHSAPSNSPAPRESRSIWQRLKSIFD
jgi:penicillin-binding protein 1A